MAETAVRRDFASTFRDEHVTTEEAAELQNLLNESVACQSRGDLPQALATLEQAILRFPLKPSLWVAAAEILLDLQDLTTALECLKQALLIDGEHVDARVVLGNVQRHQGNQAAAERHYEFAIQIQPGHIAALSNLATLRIDQGDLDSALHLLNRAANVAPDSALIAFNHGIALHHSGQLKLAREKYLPAFNRHPRPAKVLFNLISTFKATPADQPMLDLWQAHAGAKAHTDEDRALLSFSQGKIADDLCDYDSAFQHYHNANRLSQVTFDRSTHSQQIDRTIETWTRDFLKARSGWGSDSDSPIFIVGMPRSGTTLVEQILSAHSQVQPLGERDAIGQGIIQLGRSLGCGHNDNLTSRHAVEADLHEMSEAYLSIPGRDPARPRFTDKMPMNFLHLGWIATCFPSATIIHCRRDLRDVCLSCYFQNFNSKLPFSYQLEDLVAYAQDYLRLMKHWESVLPVEIVSVQYETLVETPDTEIRRLLTNCGLSPENACRAPQEVTRPVTTASAWQVQQPIYQTSRRRWENYREHISCLLAAFGTDTCDQL